MRLFSLSHLLEKHLCSRFLIRYSMITGEITGKKKCWSYELRKTALEIVLSVLENHISAAATVFASLQPSHLQHFF